MSPRTRRQTLQGAAALLAALAGCSGSSSSGGSVSSDSNRRYPPNVELDPETVTLRNPDGDRTVWRQSDETKNEKDPIRLRHGYWFVASDAAAGSLSYADVDGAQEARRFVEETDFDEETIYVQQESVGECYYLDLCYVGWGDEEVKTDFARLYRDADVACSADEDDAVATLIRIPDVIDPDDVHSFGSGVGSGACHYPPELRKRANGTNATDATEAEK